MEYIYIRQIKSDTRKKDIKNKFRKGNFLLLLHSQNNIQLRIILILVLLKDYNIIISQYLIVIKLLK